MMRFLPIKQKLDVVAASVAASISCCGLFIFDDWRFVIAGCLNAVSLYWIRVRLRILYAFVEIGFGFITLVNAIHLGKGPFTSAFSDDFLKSVPRTIFLQSFAAIYVLIRGFDNLEQATRAWRDRQRAPQGFS